MDVVQWQTQSHHKWKRNRKGIQDKAWQSGNYSMLEIVQEINSVLKLDRGLIYKKKFLWWFFVFQWIILNKKGKNIDEFLDLVMESKKLLNMKGMVIPIIYGLLIRIETN